MIPTTLRSVWLRTLAGVGVVLATGRCAPEDTGTGDVADPDAITGQNAVGRTMTIAGHVLVSPGASDATIVAAVRRQTRTVFGPLRAMSASLDDREVRTIDPRTFKREPVTVVDTANPAAPRREMLRVRYTYTARGVLHNSMARRRSISTTTLFGDYTRSAGEIITQCTDDPEARNFGADGLWYMFAPEVSTCKRAIDAEVRAIDTAVRLLEDRRVQVSELEVSRRFLPVTVKLAAIRAPQTVTYPEYDQLFGANDPSKSAMNFYGFFGVIGDREDDPNDEGYRELFFVLRNVLRARPNARFEASSPATNLLDLRVNGATVPGVTYANVVSWALGGSAPSGVSAPALRQAILGVWRGRTINLTIPMTLTAGTRTRSLDIKLHLYYGEEGAPTSGARQRYTAAFRDADVFAYSGHSHLGSGPLDPTNYRMSDFPNRYQIMMINSCVSFNYYNRDFYPLHPGGSTKLDIVTNGIEAYSDNGHSVAALFTGLIDGRQKSWIEILRGMVANEPSIGLEDYDPLRVVDGETDNTYSPRATPLRLAPRQ